MTSNMDIRALDDNEIDHVSGGFVLGLVAICVTVILFSYTAGYQAGKDQAEKENRADERDRNGG